MFQPELLKYNYKNDFIIQFLLISLLVLFPTNVVADSVTLKAKDASITITGQLSSFDGLAYIIKTPTFGELRLLSDEFNCISGNCPPKQKVVGIHGSNTIGAKLMPALIEAYAKTAAASLEVKGGKTPEELEMSLAQKNGTTLATIDLRSHGSGTATKGLASKKAVIGMMSRPLKDKEYIELRNAGLDDMRAAGRQHVLGLDALMILTAPGNTVSALTIRQVSDIFAGKITDWSQVGGKPGKIKIYAQDSKSGTFDTFNVLVLKPFENQISDKAKRFESSPDLADSVTRDKNGIGFVGYAYRRNAKALNITNRCRITVAPTDYNIKSDEYPLTRRLFLYTPELRPESFESNFIKYVLSKSAQPVIAEAGFVNLNIQMMPKLNQIARLSDAQAGSNAIGKKLLARMTEVLKRSTRLSTTIRFPAGSVNLDDKALQAVKRLAEHAKVLFVKKPGSRLLLAGFSDSQGNIKRNLRLSRIRAKAVRDQLAKSLSKEKISRYVAVRGFGSTLPVGCNATENGRAKNRRVEVWLVKPDD